MEKRNISTDENFQFSLESEMKMKTLSHITSLFIVRRHVIERKIAGIMFSSLIGMFFETGVDVKGF